MLVILQSFLVINTENEMRTAYSKMCFFCLKMVDGDGTVWSTVWLYGVMASIPDTHRLLLEMSGFELKQPQNIAQSS